MDSRPYKGEPDPLSKEKSALAGAVVFNERVDSFVLNGKHLSLPVTGVFEVSGGKIKAWRDYFDLASYMNQLKG